MAETRRLETKSPDKTAIGGSCFINAQDWLDRGLANFERSMPRDSLNLDVLLRQTDCGLLWIRVVT